MINECWIKWQLWPKNVISQILQSLYNFISILGSTSFLLGNGSSNGGSSRLVLRPLSVQERIRELNLRARHFAETVMAVQLYDTVPAGTYRVSHLKLEKVIWLWEKEGKIFLIFNGNFFQENIDPFWYPSLSFF